MRVLHVLHMSVPHIAGYTVRSKYISELQKRDGIEPIVLTSAQDPNDDAGLVLEGTSYERTAPIPRLPPVARESALMLKLYRRVEQCITRYKPDLLHAHSPCLVGLPALAGARRHRLPLVYEIRDLWENASVDRGKFSEDSAFYKGARGMETILLKRANAVVTICEKLREEIAPRVGEGTTLHVVGNGVDVEHFRPGAPNPEVVERWDFAGKRLIGYIGTFQPYEGLSTLVAALPRIAERVENVHLMITGEGGVEDELRAQVRERGLDDRVTFTGRVPHDQVRDLYTACDLMVYPRILTRTTALTTPLKPLEAMAAGTPVLVSDVPAMLELVRSGETGNIFRSGDIDDLARCAAEILTSDRRDEMGAAARAYAEKERQWPHLVAQYADIYRQALADASR